MHLMAVDRNWICPDDHRSGTNAIQPSLRPANGSAMKTMALPCSSPSSCLLAQVLVQVQSVHWDETEAGTAAGTPLSRPGWPPGTTAVATGLAAVTTAVATGLAAVTTAVATGLAVLTGR